MVGARRIRAMIVLLGLGGCTLQEITIVEVEDVATTTESGRARLGEFAILP